MKAVQKEAEKIFVDLDDEITFIVEKIKSIDNEKALLVVPDNAALISSSVSLKLLGRELNKTNKLVVLVTTDETGLELAKRTGLVAVRRVSEVNPSVWERVREQKGMELKIQKDKRDKLTASRKEQLEDEQGEKEKPTKELESLEKEKPEKKPAVPVPAEPVSKKASLSGFDMVIGGDIAEQLEKDGKSELSEGKDDQELLASKRAVEAMKNQPRRKEDSNVPKQEKPRRPREYSLVGRDLSAYTPGKVVKAGSFAERPMPESGEKGPSMSIFSNVGKAFSGLVSTLKKGGSRTYILVGVPLVAVLAIFLILSYWIWPKADVVIKVKSNDIEVEKAITAKTGVEDVDPENLTMPAELIVAEDGSSSSGVATEPALKGDKASGVATVYNKTDEVVDLAMGTVLTAKSSGLRYVVIQDVQVEAKEEDDDGVQYGVADVRFEAEDIGEDYNAEDQVRFTVEGYDEVKEISAVAQAEISGGTSEEVMTVSQNDVNNLRGSIENSLKDKLLSAIKAELGADGEMFDSQVNYEVVGESVSPGVGQEAQSFDLSLTLKASVVAFAKSDVKRLSKGLINAESEEGLEVEEDDIKYDYKLSKAVEGGIELNLSATGVLTPTLDTEKIASDIKGMSQSKAEEYLKNINNVDSYELKITPSYMVGPLKHIPFGVKNIEVRVEKVKSAS